VNNVPSIIRSQQRAIVTLAALIFGPLFMAGPIVLTFWLTVAKRFWWEPYPVYLAGVALSAYLSYHILPAYHWVELDGDTIRGRRFWTRQYVERNIHDIDQIVPLMAMAQNAPTAIADKLIGPNRGYEIRFKGNGRSIVLIRGDMTNVQELAEALAARLEI